MGAPHLGQARFTLVPHSGQNLALDGIAAPQTGHFDCVAPLTVSPIERARSAPIPRPTPAPTSPPKKWRNSKEWDFFPENKDGMFLSLALLKQTSKDSGKIVCLRIPTKNLDHDMLKIRSQNRLGLAEKDSSGRIIEHITKGAPAKDANLYKQRKEAIEYIYQDDIPMDNVELVGMTEIPEITMDNLAVWSKAEQRNVVLDALKKLFQGQPEAKGLDAMV